MKRPRGEVIKNNPKLQKINDELRRKDYEEYYGKTKDDFATVYMESAARIRKNNRYNGLKKDISKVDKIVQKRRAGKTGESGGHGF